MNKWAVIELPRHEYRCPVCEQECLHTDASVELVFTHDTVAYVEAQIILCHDLFSSIDADKTGVVVHSVGPKIGNVRLHATCRKILESPLLVQPSDEPHPEVERLISTVGYALADFISINERSYTAIFRFQTRRNQMLTDTQRQAVTPIFNVDMAERVSVFVFENTPATREQDLRLAIREAWKPRRFKHRVYLGEISNHLAVGIWSTSRVRSHDHDVTVETDNLLRICEKFLQTHGTIYTSSVYSWQAIDDIYDNQIPARCLAPGKEAFLHNVMFDTDNGAGICDTGNVRYPQAPFISLAMPDWRKATAFQPHLTRTAINFQHSKSAVPTRSGMRDVISPVILSTPVAESSRIDYRNQLGHTRQAMVVFHDMDFGMNENDMLHARQDALLLPEAPVPAPLLCVGCALHSTCVECHENHIPLVSNVPLVPAQIMARYSDAPGRRVFIPRDMASYTEGKESISQSLSILLDFLEEAPGGATYYQAINEVRYPDDVGAMPSGVLDILREELIRAARQRLGETFSPIYTHEERERRFMTNINKLLEADEIDIRLVYLVTDGQLGSFDEASISRFLVMYQQNRQVQRQQHKTEELIKIVDDIVHNSSDLSLLRQYREVELSAFV